MTDSSPPHPLSGELYTPITPEILGLLEQLHARYGSWRVVAYHANTRVKVLQNIRKRRHAISMRVLDRILTETGTGNIDNYTWFTAEDMVVLGIWKPVRFLDGTGRIQAGEAIPALTPQQRRLVKRKKPKRGVRKKNKHRK